MTLFLISVALVLGVSGLCALAEAAIYAVGRPYARQLAESGSLAGRALTRFKENMEQPISAILILDTAANTAGSAVAGAQARVLFGQSSLIWFSAGFALTVLLVSQILPKVIGIVYSRIVARAVALPIAGMIVILYPVVWAIQRLTSLVKPDEPVLHAPEEEVRQLAIISAEEGSILEVEARLIQNSLSLNEVQAGQIMTPRPVVVKLPAEMTVGEACDTVGEWSLSRIPIYARDDPDTWTGLVLSRDILAEVAKDRHDIALAALAKPVFFVSEKTPGHELLDAFLKRRSHLFGVVDEFGDTTGVVSLEDVVESLLGKEIVDEKDSAVDLQQVARLRHAKKSGNSNASRKPNDDEQPAT